METGRGIRKIIMKWMALLFLVLSFTVLRGQAATDYQVEQVYINMPDVTAYYRCPEDSGIVEGYLGGEKLEQKSMQAFANTGEAVEYYVLVDISASIRSSRFEDIKSSLTEFLNGIRENDRMVLLTFGDTVQTVLTGDESREDAANVISQLTNNNQNTVLFEAIDQAAEMIVTAGNSSVMRRVEIVISDGKDCADDTRSIESVGNDLTEKGIPLYTLAVENNEGDSETEISTYRGKFSALSRNTGGIPWVISDDTNVLAGLNAVQGNVLASYRAQFQASSNKVSNQNEDFVLKFANGRTDTVSVLVSRGQADTEAPQVLSISSTESNAIEVTYSESVTGADKTSSYKVTKDGKSIPVRQVVESSDVANTYTLLFDDDFYTGSYQVNIIGVTDNSNEENALEGATQTLQIDGLEEEKDLTVTNHSELVKGTNEDEEENTAEGAEEGDTIKYTIKVKNTGVGKLTGITLTDSMSDLEGFSWVDADGKSTSAPASFDLAAKGDTATFYATYKVTAEDVDNNETIKNTATAKVGEDGPSASAEDEGQEPEEKGFSLIDFAKDYWYLLLAAAVLLIGVIVLIVVMVKRRKENGDGNEWQETPPEPTPIEGRGGGDSGRVLYNPLPSKQVVLWISNGIDEPKRMEFNISGSCIVGRSSQCDICCDDPMMSRQHFVLELENGNIFVSDLQSANGTSVNGVTATERHRLESRDEIAAGNLRFRIEW